jgi:hypothetical protein
MPITLDGTNGITTPMYNGSITANAVTPSVNMKNRLINSAMVIDQRNAGASFSSSVNGVYSLDRWYNQNNTSGTRFSVQQNAGNVTCPNGFSNYLGVTTASAYTVGSTDVIGIGQYIEGYNIADLGWGTANAKTVTLSFWVRSSLTGTFGGSLHEGGAATAFYPYTYTISAANTWEYKTVTVVGPTIGTWQTTNSRGLSVLFNLGTGATFSGAAGSWSASPNYAPTGVVSVVGTSSATFYITGVQLEVGSTATSFDYRPYGTELALCQRYYYQTWGFGTFTNVGGGNVCHVLPSPNNASSNGASSFPVFMRAAPTITLYDSLGASGNVSQPAVANGLAATAGSISIGGFNNITKDSTTFTVGTPVTCQFTASIEL